jgi:hypothetical protein
MNGDLKEIGGLWLKNDKNGHRFLSGEVNNDSVICFKNKYKEEGSNKPDFIVYLGAEKKAASASVEEDPF